jgi:hypothetical protein
MLADLLHAAAADTAAAVSTIMLLLMLVTGKKCLKEWGGGVIGVRICTNLNGPPTAYDDMTSTSEFDDCHSFGITTQVFLQEENSHGYFDGDYWTGVPGYQVVDIGSGLLDGFFYTMQETNMVSDV